MKKNIKIILSVQLVAFVFVANVQAQKISDEYWDAVGVADRFYNEAMYDEAAAAFEVLWTKKHEEEIANDRLHAAAANCMIDNEEGVKENLFKIISVASKTDRKRVLVNYEIFNKYKNRTWWSELENKLNLRIEQLIAHHKNLRIFQKGRNFKYSAVRVTNEGDTVANTFVTCIPDGTGWGDEAATVQSQVIFRYEFTTQDSLDHILELDTIAHRQFWERKDTTGIEENEKTIWMHPIRNNEFFKTELAPFPEVKLPISDSSNHTFTSETHIMSNWGSYTNTVTKCESQYQGEEKRSYAFKANLDCHKYTGTGENSRHGTSKIEFFFHEEYGFVEMNYETYDGDIIRFMMIEIIGQKY